MPVLLVYGIPPKTSQLKLEKLCGQLIRGVMDTPELGLKEEEIVCFFPSDLMLKGLGEEIIIFVDGLFEKLERTEEVRSKLAGDLVIEVRKVLPNIKHVVCLIRPFNSRNGFACFAQ